MTATRVNPRVLARAIARAVVRATAPDGGGGGGGGAATGTPVQVQVTPGISLNGVAAGAYPLTFPAPTAVGNGLAVVLEWFQGGSAGISSVTHGGAPVPRDVQGTGTASRTEVYHLDTIPTSATTVIINVAGATTYCNAYAIECSALAGLDAGATTNTTSSSATPSATSPALAQAANLIVAAFRDNSGVINVAATPTTPPLLEGFLQRDGVTNLGGVGGHKLVNRQSPAVAAFATTITQWFELLAALKFALPGGALHRGSSVQFWAGSDAWNPLTLSHVSAAATGVLVTLGAWWDGNRSIGVAGARPTDNNGTLLGAINPVGQAGGGTGQLQLAIQIADEFNPAIATHAVTPPNLLTDGDGCMTMVYIPGMTARRCSGYTRNYHTPFGAPGTPDPSTIQDLSIVTTGADPPQIGDIAVMVVGIDPNSETNADCQWTPPPGWTVLTMQFNMTDVIGYLVCIARVSTAGHMTVPTSWIDNATFWAEGGIQVYKP